MQKVFLDDSPRSAPCISPPFDIKPDLHGPPPAAAALERGGDIRRS
jgi:hypothetical protein